MRCGPISYSEERQQRTQEWLQTTTATIIERLRYRAEHFRENPQGGSSAPTIEQQEAKFGFINGLLALHDERKGKRFSSLERIIKGYLTEFIDRSERETPPVNIEHGRNPEARAYWEEHPAEFEAERFRGVFQTAASYNHLREKYGRRGQHSPAFHAVGEIIRNTVDVFKEEYPKLDPDHAPNPSIYNNHDLAIKAALVMRDFKKHGASTVAVDL